MAMRSRIHDSRHFHASHGQRVVTVRFPDGVVTEWGRVHQPPRAVWCSSWSWWTCAVTSWWPAGPTW